MRLRRCSARAVSTSDAPGVVSVAKGFDGFIALAKQHKIWDRDKLVNPPR